MSNVSNIILSIQDRMKNSSNSLELMTLSKVIEKLNLRSVTSVANFSDLPSLETDGNIFLVYSEEELYYNVGNTWYSLGKILLDLIYTLGTNTNSGNPLPSGNRSSPVTIAGGITNWSKVSAGRFHHFGIADGVLYAWGSGGTGRLGTGNNFGVTTPVTVVGGITDWTAVSCSNTHSLGIAGGIAYGWGDGGLGRIGDGTTISRSSPVTIVGGITDWTQVSAGRDFGVGIANGIAYGWGNSYGSGAQTSSPVTVSGGITGWTHISTLDRHILGVAGGIAYAWGLNAQGRLGDNTSTTRFSPVTVVGGITDWSQVSAGYRHSLGVTSSGVAYAWGYNGFGQLGINAAGAPGTVSVSSPVTIVGGITNWTQVSGGLDFSLGLTNNGVIYGWGQNSSGQLGTNDTVRPSSPVTVVGGITDWSQVSAGGSSHSFAVASSIIKSYTV